MGGLLSVARLAFPPKTTWSVHDIPDLTGKVVLVTGACRKRDKRPCAQLDVVFSRSQVVTLVSERKL